MPQFDQQTYNRIVQNAWQQSQSSGQSNDAGRQQEAGHSGGSTKQAQQFANALLSELSQAGCSNISDALECAKMQRTQGGNTA